MQLLVSHGASIDLRGGTDSWTPLMYAAMAGEMGVALGVANKMTAICRHVVGVVI